MFFIGYCAGCIGAPQLWTHKPRYFSGVVTAIVTWIFLVAAVIAWWLLCSRENSKRDAKTEEVGDDVFDLAVESVDAIDLTDKQDKTFRYTW